MLFGNVIPISFCYEILEVKKLRFSQVGLRTEFFGVIQCEEKCLNYLGLI